MLRVGTDILFIPRMRRACENKVAGFPSGVFSPAEIRESDERADPVLYFATRFAGKEAVFKALALPAVEIRLGDIEILATETARPQVSLLGALKTLCDEQGVTCIDVSLSYDTDYAIAFAVVQSVDR